jgi:hypothetical protein
MESRSLKGERLSLLYPGLGHGAAHRSLSSSKQGYYISCPHPGALMATIEYRDLNILDPEAIIAYERALFRAFTATDTVILERIWDFDRPQKRARTRIPYSSQRIFTACLEGRIIGGAAMNLNMQAPLQLEAMGFSIDKSASGVCEGIALFNLQIFSGATMVAAALRDYSLGRIQAENIRALYGTCSQRRMRGYSMLGWKPVAEKAFERGTVYLILLELPQR